MIAAIGLNLPIVSHRRIPQRVAYWCQIVKTPSGKSDRTAGFYQISAFTARFDVDHLVVYPSRDCVVLAH